MMIKLTLLLLITTSYTLIRYVAFGSVNIDQIPVYLLNKSIALSAVCCLYIAVFNIDKQEGHKKFWGNAAFHFTAIHLVISTIILNSEYFPKLFDSQQMNLAGELTILFGVLAGYIFWVVRNHQFTLIKSKVVKPKVLKAIALVFILGHLIAIGANGWITLELWNGGLPPISLLSFIIVMIVLLKQLTLNTK